MKYKSCPKCQTKNEARYDGRYFVCRACSFHERDGYSERGVAYQPVIPVGAAACAQGVFLSVTPVLPEIVFPSPKQVKKELTYKMKIAFDAARLKLQNISKQLSPESTTPYHEARKDQQALQAKLSRCTPPHFHSIR